MTNLIKIYSLLRRILAKNLEKFKIVSPISRDNQLRVTLKIQVTTRVTQTDIQIFRDFLESNLCLAPLKVFRILMTLAADRVKLVHKLPKSLKKRRSKRPLSNLRGNRTFLISRQTHLSTKLSVNQTTHKTKKSMISRHQVGKLNLKKSQNKAKIKKLRMQTVFHRIQNQNLSTKFQ